MLCAISGEIPNHPVVSLKTGHVFEKKLVEKYIAEKGTCPITGEPLTKTDLLSLQVTHPVAKPRGPTATSIPSLLVTLQNEWDSVMLENHSLRSQLEQARQELAHTLYQHDAACRVISRLVKERDAVMSASVHSNPTNDVEMALPSSGIPSHLVNAISVQSTELSQERRKRKIPEETASLEDVSSFKLNATLPGLHSASTPGITCLSVQDNLILSGGPDKHVVLYDRENERILHTLKGHTKRISDVILHGNMSYSASFDKTVRIWQSSTENADYETVHILRHHQAEVASLALHPLGTLLFSAGFDGRWILNDIPSGNVLIDFTVDGAKELHSLQVHPDGILFAAGSDDSAIRIWDVKSQQNVASFKEGLEGTIRSISFSENGYHLASSDSSHVVKVWDLRKLAVVKSFSLPENSRVNNVNFDSSGQYLSAAGDHLQIFSVKQEQPLWNLAEDERSRAKEIYDVAFGKFAKEIIVGSHDRNVRIFSCE